MSPAIATNTSRWGFGTVTSEIASVLEPCQGRVLECLHSWVKAFLCLAQEVPALADISSTSDALGTVSEELVLGPSGLTSTDQSTQIKQVSHTLPSKAVLKLAAASAVLSMISVTFSLS